MKYQESLSFSHPVLWVILLLLSAFLGYGAVHQIIYDQPFGNNPAPDHLLLVFVGIPALLLTLLLGARLRISIDEEAISYRFLPFHFKWHHIPWREIEAVYVRKYRPIYEFGGWGLRINLRGNRAYNVMVDKGMGMEILRKDGKKILFSTRKPRQLRSFLDELSSKGKPL
jgi:hypothetical protein